MGIVDKGHVALGSRNRFKPSRHYPYSGNTSGDRLMVKAQGIRNTGGCKDVIEIVEPDQPGVYMITACRSSDFCTGT